MKTAQQAAYMVSSPPWRANQASPKAQVAKAAVLTTAKPRAARRVVARRDMGRERGRRLDSPSGGIYNSGGSERLPAGKSQKRPQSTATKSSSPQRGNIPVETALIFALSSRRLRAIFIG